MTANRVVVVAVVLLAAVCRADGDWVAGVDISILPDVEAAGVVFKQDGRPKDALAVFTDHGVNVARLRLFVNPDNSPGVVNDLPYTIALAKRCRAAGLSVLLDLHYSDTWADPGKQHTPAAWAGRPLPQLCDTVEAYTATVVKTMSDNGVRPAYVQVGNEIANGMLWPTAKFDNRREPDAPVFDRLAALLKAAVRGVHAGAAGGPVPKIIVHAAGGGKQHVVAWFFEGLSERGVPFDVIGLSFYPFEGETLPTLAGNMNALAAAHGKPVLVVETAAAWADSAEWRAKKLPWPATPDGQRRFLADVVAAVRAVPDGRGLGVAWWFPDSVPVKNAPRVNPYHGGTWALFDSAGNALPAVGALR